jgi:hypothetical protein
MWGLPVTSFEKYCKKNKKRSKMTEFNSILIGYLHSIYKVT